MSRSRTLLLAVFLLTVVLAGCGTAAYGNGTPTAGPSLPTDTDTGVRDARLEATAPEGVAGAVLATLPRYPGASAPPPDAQAGFATSPNVSICNGDRCPRVHTASEQFAGQATDEEIDRWYWDRLTTSGYRYSGRSFGANKGRPYSDVRFFLPARPDVTVEVHFYPQADGVTVVDVLVVYLEPLSKPDGPVIPLDVERVEIEYFPDGARHVIDGTADIRRLTGLVNALPVRPDYVTLGPIEVREEGATLTFVSAGGGPWEVRVVRGRPFRVEFEPYPDLYDTRGLLWEAIQEVTGVKPPYEARPWPGRPAPPTPLPSVLIPTPAAQIPTGPPTPVAATPTPTPTPSPLPVSEPAVSRSDTADLAASAQVVSVIVGEVLEGSGEDTVVLEGSYRYGYWRVRLDYWVVGPLSYPEVTLRFVERFVYADGTMVGARFPVTLVPGEQYVFFLSREEGGHPPLEGRMFTTVLGPAEYRGIVAIDDGRVHTIVNGQGQEEPLEEFLKRVVEKAADAGKTVAAMPTPTQGQAADDVLPAPGLGPVYRGNMHQQGEINPWPRIESTEVELGDGPSPARVTYRDRIDTKAGQTRNIIFRVYLPDVALDARPAMEVRLGAVSPPAGITVTEGFDWHGSDPARRSAKILHIDIAAEVKPGVYSVQIGVEINGINYGAVMSEIRVLE